jgi:hypothetical protein
MVMYTFIYLAAKYKAQFHVHLIESKVHIAES